MRLLIFPAVLAVLWLVCFAPWVWLVHWATQLSLSTLVIGSLLVTPVYVFLSMQALRNGPDWIARASMQFLGVGSVGWPLLIPGWIASFVIADKLVALVFAVAWLTLAVIAYRNATRLQDRFLQLTDVRITKPLRLLQISDVHIGSRTTRFLEKVVDRVLSHEPDLVMITGDLLDLSSVDAGTLRSLSRINVPVYMCIGNHERYVDFDKAIDSIRSHNVIVLRDEVAMAHDIQVIGIDDADQPDRVSEVIRNLELSAEHYSVVLYHRPDGWEHVRNHGLPLMLAGHTHNGQVWPFNWLVKWRYPEISGSYQAHNNGRDHHLHVSSGTGTWGPTFRLGSKCEVTVIDLQGA